MDLTGEAGASDSLPLCCLLPRLREGWLEQVVGVLHTPTYSYCTGEGYLELLGEK